MTLIVFDPRTGKKVIITVPDLDGQRCPEPD